MSISSIASRTRMPVVWMRAPGSRFASTTATLRPREAAVRAAARPAKLAPTMMRSNCIVSPRNHVETRAKRATAAELRRDFADLVAGVATRSKRLRPGRSDSGAGRTFRLCPLQPLQRRDAEGGDPVAVLAEHLEAEAVEGE